MGRRSELRTRTKVAGAAAESGDANADELVRTAMKRIDQAAAKGVIHKNEAARRKSRLARQAGGGKAAKPAKPAKKAPKKTVAKKAAAEKAPAKKTTKRRSRKKKA
jgi:small subunit ribosomal protein S20